MCGVRRLGQLLVAAERKLPRGRRGCRRRCCRPHGWGDQVAGAAGGAKVGAGRRALPLGHEAIGVRIERRKRVSVAAAGAAGQPRGRGGGGGAERQLAALQPKRLRRAVEPLLLLLLLLVSLLLLLELQLLPGGRRRRAHLGSNLGAKLVPRSVVQRCARRRLLVLSRERRRIRPRDGARGERGGERLLHRRRQHGRRPNVPVDRCGRGTEARPRESKRIRVVL